MTRSSTSLSDLLPKSSEFRQGGPFGMGRPLDLKEPSNRLALLGLGLGVLLAKFRGRSWGEALRVGGSVFGAWAAGRELDPDDALSAALAMPLAGLAALGDPPGGAELLGGGASLNALRVTSGTVGLAPTRIDALLIAGQAAAAALAGERVAALAPGLALVLSAQQRDAQSPPVQVGPLTLAAGLLPQLGRGRARATSPLTGALIVAGILVAPVLLTVRTPSSRALRSRCDLSPLRVSGARVQASRQLGLSLLVAGLLSGERRSLVPLAAASLGTALTSLWRDLER